MMVAIEIRNTADEQEEGRNNANQQSLTYENNKKRGKKNFW